MAALTSAAPCDTGLRGHPELGPLDRRLASVAERSGLLGGHSVGSAETAITRRRAPAAPDHAAARNHEREACGPVAPLGLDVGVLVEAEHGNTQVREPLGLDLIEVGDHQVDAVEPSGRVERCST